MDQHLGASIPLSFALVGVFAIVLYQPEHPPTLPATRAGPVVAPQELRPSPTVPPPPVTPVEPMVARPVRPASEPPVGPKENPAEPIAVRPLAPGRRVRTSLSTAQEGAAHDAFTLTEEGE